MRAMGSYTAFYLTGHFWAVISVLSATVVAVSSIADRRRGRRSNIEAVGFMPWTAITVLSVLATVLSIALAIKS